MPTKAQLETKLVAVEARIAEFEAKPELFERVSAALPPFAEMTPWQRPRAELARLLAGELDAGVDQKSLASVAKELRECLAGLEASFGDDDDADGGFFARMSSPVGDAAD